MKRFFVLALTLVLMLSLSACGNKDNTSSNKSSGSINATTSSNEPTVSSKSSSVSPSTQDIQGTKMNLTQIQAGNYSSLLGTWTGVAYANYLPDGTGKQWRKANIPGTLSVLSDKIAYNNEEMVIQRNTLKDSAGSHPLSFKNNGGSLDALNTDYNVVAPINWGVSFYQKGAKNDIKPNNGVKIDNTKNLIVIWTWTSNNGFTVVFAQTDASNSAANSSSKTTTSTN